MIETTTWVVGAGHDGERLDRYVSAHLDLARNRVQRWIRDERISVDGAPAKPSSPVAEGQTVLCRPEVPADDSRALDPEDGPLDVLWEDPHLAVLAKPPGLAVHPGAGRPTGTLAHRLVRHWPEIAGVGHPRRPGIVHRLDLDTTGVLVVARTDSAYRGLSAAFAERRVEKTYVALVWGVVEPPRRSISLPIARHPTDRQRMAVVETGRPSITHLHRQAQGQGISWLEVDLETGRTHQIRVHCKAIGHPLLGDPVYGEDRWKGLRGPVRRRLAEVPRPALHAVRLAFAHPITGEHVEVDAPVPDDLRDLWRDVTGLAPPEV